MRRMSAQQTAARSPYLAHYLDEGVLALVGGVYDVATGKVEFLDPLVSD